MPRPFRLASFPLLAALVACDGGGAVEPDAGTPDASGPAACNFRGLHWSHASVGVTPGATRRVFLELDRDYVCGALDVEITSRGTGALSGLPERITFRTGETTRHDLDVTGASEGTVTLTARGVDANGQEQSADLEVVVTDAALPPCDGEARGTVAPGDRLEVASGSIAGVRIAVAAGAARDDAYHVDPFDVSIGCAPDQTPEGYRALGPAIAFTSPDVYRFRREIEFAIPIRLSLLPSRAHRGHVEVAYTGPGVRTPRIVGIASPVFEGSPGAGLLRFQAPRLGTYQAVVRADAPTVRRREFRFRGILGFSMGGSGAGRIGVGNPDRFDFVAPLGGPTDWIYMLEYVRRYHLGGFCTEAERRAGTVDCSAGSQDRAPPRDELFEHPQHFEHWWYEDAYTGQGGTFDRSEYIEIFRDLAAMFGNPNTDASADPDAPNVTPPGTPDEDRYLPDSQRCRPEARRVIRGTDAMGTNPWFDDEYNPEGRYDVITFCDGPEVPGDVGRWNPAGEPFIPVEVAYAVDLDGDGIRDPGEPVIRNGREPFDDVGRDGVPSPMESGYDAVANPDPAGDDYDYQYNPTGTEGNWEHDEGEPFDDVGLDGVAGTRQLADGGWDSGEGNGRFDRARGAERMIASSPRGLVRTYDLDTVRRFDWFADGGVRDLFNWVVMGHHSSGAFAARGLPVRYYNGHASLHLDGRNRDDEFSFIDVPYDEIGRYAMVRYGSIDASEAEKINGDGGHVGTVDQLTNRVYSALALMDRRWPGGDRRRVSDQLCPAISPSCPHVNQFTIDFTSERAGRTGPMSIVLPPGYFDPENADRRYPVVYFLHGYGMEPQDLLALGLLLWNYMNAPNLPESRRIQKMIFVFPDGRCRGRECLNGTFYTDAPPSTPNGPRMQTFLLDFMDYMDANYRTRRPETIEVLE